MLSSNYILILLWCALLGVITLLIPQVYRHEKVNEMYVKRIRPCFAVIVILPLVIWTCQRGNIGDTFAYIDSFREMPMKISEISQYMETVTKDFGFYFCSAIIKCVIGNREKIYFFILAALQAYLLFRIYRKYSTNFLISFFIFIAGSDYISWMFNGIRQFTAATIVFSTLPWILTKKYIRTIIVILLASLIHGSALITIPFIFIVQGKAWNKKTLFFIAGVIAVVLFADRFTDILDMLLTDTQYEDSLTIIQDDGTNIFRVLVYSIPALLSLIGLKNIRNIDDRLINICTNMSIATVGFYVISMFTSGILLGRIPVYFYLYNYGATLYPGSTAFTALAPKLFEKVDPSKESETNYKSSNADIVSAVSTGLFGWGFQPTTTWLDNVEDATLSLNYTENALTSIDIGVYITADLGSGTGAQHISYNYSNFGTTKVEKFEEYLSSLSEAN